MTQDYAAIGFKAGLEIHQQLETHKLFCNCPSLVRDDEPEFTIHRQLFASAGEGGIVDKAAAYESAKRRTYHYEGRSTSSCLVELDEEPPHEINLEALHTALLVAKLLHASIVDTIIVMRKVVIDGSNISGFQRTALIATSGSIETSKGRVSIPTICLEEESAKKVREDRESVTYRLDRLGIPLIEIATGPELKDPEHVQEAAKIIGSMLRATGKVKRGIGTIRQDVNVSIAKGARVEIKGFQDLRSIPKVVEFEVERQLNEPNNESHVRKAEENLTTTYLRPMPGAARMYPETDIPFIFISQSVVDSLKPPRDPQEELSRIVEQYGITKDQGEALLKNRGLVAVEVFETIMRGMKQLKGSFVAEFILSYEKESRRNYPDTDTTLITQDSLQQTIALLDAGQISKDALIAVLHDLGGGSVDLSKYTMTNDTEIKDFVTALVAQNPLAPPSALMGKVMEKYRGKVDGK